MAKLAQNEIQSDLRSFRAESVASHRRRSLRVLFIHRDADAIDCSVRELEKAQFSVNADFVLNLEQCAERLHSQSYDVVVAEYPSPSWRGSRNLQILQQTLQETPLVFVTTATEALKPLVLGIGCRKDVPVDRIEAAVLLALNGYSLNQVREIATVDLKANEPGLQAFCAAHDIPLRVFSHATLAARAWCGKPSEWVRKNINLDGVCEPCALVACARGKLIVPKTTLDGVAVAVVWDMDEGGAV